jgi:hypothetical protein
MENHLVVSSAVSLFCQGQESRKMLLIVSSEFGSHLVGNDLLSS